MSLAEEIAVYQFAQGVGTDTDPLNPFSQLEENEQRIVFFDLCSLVKALKPTAADMEQALTESSLGADYSPCLTQRGHQLGIITIHSPEGKLKLEQDYTFLLYVFKAAYQRRTATGKENSADWHSRDLSKPEIVQDILTQHQALADDVYNTPGFRSEFIALAKLWHDRRNSEQEPSSESQTTFDFLTYDEVVTKSIRATDDKYYRAINLLRGSLEKALSVKYRLATDSLNRVVLDVIGRHFREKYNSELF